MLRPFTKKLAILAAIAAALLLPIGAACAKGGGGGGGGGGKGGGGGAHPGGGGGARPSFSGGVHPGTGSWNGHPGNGSPGNGNRGNGNRGNGFDRDRDRFFVGGFWWGGPWWGWDVYPGYWDTWGYGGGYPAYSDYYDQGVVAVPPSYTAPETYSQSPSQQMPSLDPNAVYVDLSVPDANADVWINGVKTDQKGMIRPFVSPPLTPGKSYSYEFKVQWKEGGQIFNETREVSVRAGDRYKLKFTAPAVPMMPKPKETNSGEVSITK